MFELFELPNFPSPFPSKSVGLFRIDELVEAGFSVDEILDALDGKVIQNRYIIDFAPSFMRRLQIDQLVRDYPDGLSESEIADVLNITQNNVSIVMFNAKKKLHEKGCLKKLLENIRELRRLRARREKWNITIKGSLAVEIVGGNEHVYI